MVNILDGLRFWPRNNDACGAARRVGASQGVPFAGNGLVSHEYGNGRVPLLRQEVGHTFSDLHLGFCSHGWLPQSSDLATRNFLDGLQMQCTIRRP